MKSADQQHTYSICLSNLPIGTNQETLLKVLSGVNVITKSCAFTQNTDNRAEAEMWFKDNKLCDYNANIME